MRQPKSKPIGKLICVERSEAKRLSFRKRIELLLDALQTNICSTDSTGSLSPSAYIMLVISMPTGFGPACGLESSRNRTRAR